MIDGSGKRKGQLVFELQSSRVYEKRSNEELSIVSSLARNKLTYCAFHKHAKSKVQKTPS